MSAGGLKITQLGGDAQVIPTQNPDQLGLFRSKRVDAVWAVEPWLSRLEREASGKIIVDEKDVATTVLVSSAKFLNEKRDLAKKFVQAHNELTDWIVKNSDEAQRVTWRKAAEIKVGADANSAPEKSMPFRRLRSNAAIGPPRPL